MAKVRADELLVSLGLAANRSKAKALVLSGAVCAADGEVVNKAGTLLPDDARLALKTAPHPFVSRGGVKLDAALETFGLGVTDSVALDVGASTGGFSDCLLQRGARRIYAVDVGYNQLDWRLRNDSRVVVLERQNMRTMDLDLVPEPVDVVVLDVSFISLRLVLPNALALARDGADVVALVKPQFEVGKADVGKGGIVRDDDKRQEALGRVIETCVDLGIAAPRTMESPITGAKGNIEYLLYGRFHANKCV